MRQRNVKNQDEILNNFDRYVVLPESLKGKWKDNYTEIHLEIGIGKGQFIYNKAIQNPHILFVGIELNKGVVALATKKIRRLEDENRIKANNLRLFTYDAAKLQDVFNFGEVDRIYLNFSDPWPKKKHEKRRLTSKAFLDAYRKILSPNGIIEQKTDNRHLMEYSIMSYNRNSVVIEDISLDVYNDIENLKIQDNVATEYEEKFREKGPIYKIVVRLGGE